MSLKKQGLALKRFCSLVAGFILTQVALVLFVITESVRVFRTQVSPNMVYLQDLVVDDMSNDFQGDFAST